MERLAARGPRRRHRAFRNEKLVQRADYFCPQRSVRRRLHRNRIDLNLSEIEKARFGTRRGGLSRFARLLLALQCFTFRNNYARKAQDSYVVCPPCISGESGLTAGLRQELLAAQSVFDGHLRQQQSTPAVLTNDQAMSAELDL